jgi:hypothetical protein
MEHEEAELDDMDEDEDEDALVGLRADCDAASCPEAPRPCTPPRRTPCHRQDPLPLCAPRHRRARAPPPPRHGARGG